MCATARLCVTPRSCECHAAASWPVVRAGPGSSRESRSPSPSPDGLDWRLGSSGKTDEAGRRRTLRQDGGGEPAGVGSGGPRSTPPRRRVLRRRAALEPSERRRGGVALHAGLAGTLGGADQRAVPAPPSEIGARRPRASGRPGPRPGGLGFARVMIPGTPA